MSAQTGVDGVEDMIVSLLRSVGLATALLAALPSLSLGAPAEAVEAGAEETELGPIFLLSLGGKLYDNLWIVLDETAPGARNPGLQGGLSMPPQESWRCVTCHGWDYSGATIGDTRFPGLMGLSGLEADIIKQRMLAPDHPFPMRALPDLAIDLLALFISNGLYQRSDFIGDDNRPVGDAEFGRDIFEGACINCHALDGRMYLRGEIGDRSSLGWIARNRPEQALHKILNGVPGAEMLSLRFLSADQIADLFAYIQTLDPTEQ